MAFDAHTNFAYSTIATAPSPATSGTTLNVQPGDGALFPTAPFNVTIWPAGAIPLAGSAEIVRVTSKGSGDNWTIARTQEGSSTRSVIAGDQIAATITVKTATDIEGTGILRPAGGGLETVNTVASSGSSKTLDLGDGNVHDVTLTAACTITLAGATSGKGCTMTLLLRQDGTGGRTVTWPGSVTWLGGVTPVLQSAASALDVITLFTLDGGTTWIGAQAVSPAPSFAFAEVLTSESTTSSSFADLATVGPAATVTVGPSGMVLVGWNCQFGTGTISGEMAVALSGANTLAANDNWALYNGSTAGNGHGMGRTYVFTGLTPGSTTFKAKYKSNSGGTYSFLRRSLWAQAM
jgi:hypothetical protein